MKKIVIVGGVAGGASTAARLRRLDEAAEIILFEKDTYISFANCGLPYHIGGVIAERKELIVQSPEAMRTRFRIDVRTHSRVASVDTARNVVRVESAERGEYEESYDALVLCPGAEPVSLFQQGMERVLTLRNIDDTDRINRFVVEHGVQTAAILGGGFIGVEMAENLRMRGVAVRLIEAMDHILPPFDADMAAIVHKELRANSVELTLSQKVTALEAAGDAVRIMLDDGSSFETDLVVSAVGVRPATEFLKGSGIALGPRGHIITDAYMRTNIKNVYAAGDAALITDYVTGQSAAIPLAGPANRQARTVADSIAGLDHPYKGAQGSAVVKVFGLTAAVTGANESALKRAGIPYHKIYTHPFSHATYYPGAVQIDCKLLFHPDGRILGCQMVGAEGVDKRLDVVATALRLKAHVTDLCDLELAYAPPYSSAKDPVNMLGYVAQNVLEGISSMADFEDAETYDPASTTLLDVRTSREFERGHLPGAVNIPVDALRDRLQELDPNKEVLEYCQVGVRAHTAQRILSQNGFKVRNVTGGYKTYSAKE